MREEESVRASCVMKSHQIRQGGIKNLDNNKLSVVRNWSMHVI